MEVFGANRCARYQLHFDNHFGAAAYSNGLWSGSTCYRFYIARYYIRSMRFQFCIDSKKEISDTDYSSGLIVSIGIAAILYFLLFVCAPQIADFYNVDELIKITRVLALLLFPGAITSIQIAKLTRELQFKPLFFASTSATLASAFIGIFWHGNSVASGRW